MTLPPKPGAARPAPPPLRLPRPRRRPGGFIASLLFHAVILVLLTRYGVEWVLGSGPDRFGPRGGGGGAGGSVRLIDLPAAAAPASATPVQRPPVQTVPPLQPDPVLTLPPTTIQPLSMTAAPVVASTATASAGTSGEGPGTGGGTGGGVGTGTGNDSGPGRGGNGAYIPPSIRTLLIQPPCVRGRVTVLFTVASDGHVAQVTVEPEPKDGSCRRELLDKMKAYQFLPATRNGQAVAATFQVILGQ